MIDFTKASWINEPQKHEVTPEKVLIVTEPETDFWQRSYYGFRNDNGHGLLLEGNDNFTFTVKVECDYRNLFDQCGLLIYLDSDNWVKASIEFDNDRFSRLGSVVTNMGYSDWATTDITLPSFIWYRLSRRGPDFLVESSLDGGTFQQMRIFHLFQLGSTTQEMGSVDPPIAPTSSIRFGLYACSPLQSTFSAVFSEMRVESCMWRAHGVV